MSHIVQTTAFVDHGGLPLWVAINWSWSSLRSPASVHYIVIRPPSTLSCSYIHPIACCSVLLLRPVIWTVIKCASWAIFSVAAIAESPCSNQCLFRCCVSARGSFDEAPVIQLDSDSITPGWGVCGAMTCGCGKREEQLLVMCLGQSVGQHVVGSHKRSIGCHCNKKRKWQAPHPILKMTVDGVSMIEGLASSLTPAWGCHYCSHTSFWLTVYVKRLKNT